MKKRHARKSRSGLPLSALLILVCTGIYAADNGIDGVLTQLKADNLVIVQAGEVVYQANCASCHGKYLQGQLDWRQRDKNGFLPAPPHDASGHTWHHADDQLFEITKYGPGAVMGDTSYKSLMPAYQHILTDEDIVAALSFIKNTWPEDERQWQTECHLVVVLLMMRIKRHKAIKTERF